MGFVFTDRPLRTKKTGKDDDNDDDKDNGDDDDDDDDNNNEDDADVDKRVKNILSIIKYEKIKMYAFGRQSNRESLLEIAGDPNGVIMNNFTDVSKSMDFFKVSVIFTIHYMT